MTVKILGTGCPKCQTLEARVQEVASRHGLQCEIQKVTDLSQIMEYGVMMTPSLVVNEEVKSVGTIPPEEHILQWLQGV